VSDWKTKLIHSEARVPQGFRSFADPTWRGSTVLFDNVASILNDADPFETGYSYGLLGTPTAMALAARICELEGGFRTAITPGGLAAITLVDMALLKAGDHVLIPANVYGPNRILADRLLKRFGVESSTYAPGVGADIREHFRPNTRLVWTESPGSITMEVPDLPAIIAAAHEHGALVALDNTWAAGVYFDAFAHGVDVAVQALTKYVGGHGDLLLGSVTAATKDLWKPIREAQEMLGVGISPDECALALRGMKTLALRLDHTEKTTLELATWLATRPEIECVLHPALPSCPGHENWKRDFTGSSGVFSIVFSQGTPRHQVQAFVDALKLFGIGYSWGGVASVVMTYDFSQAARCTNYGYRLVRLSIGLESLADLKADIAQAFAVAAEKSQILDRRG